MATEHVEDFWPSISDLMAGLMMIFMLIAISFMLKVNQEKDKIEDIAKQYRETKIEIYNDLTKEFSKDLKKWDAYIDEDTLSVKFNEPDIFFKQGSSELNKKFKNILEDFFPRYIKILSSKKYENDIEEVRIEGHTSSEWVRGIGLQESYFRNMELSQGRTRKTLEYVMSLERMKKYSKFMISKVTANGLSFSKRIMNKGVEEKKMSRRVEFKIRTSAETKINEILKSGEKNENN
jgi:outer membrane protein OmpA-like peptidoglycan-associated protein